MLSIIPGSCGLNIANRLAEKYCTQLIIPAIKKFADQEIKVRVPNKLAPIAIIVQAVAPPSNDNLMELVLLSDAVRRAGAKKIISIIPYLGYSRQAKSYADFECVSSEVVEKILNINIDEVITVDTHHRQYKQHIDTTSFFCDYLNSKPNICLVAPDKSAHKKVKEISTILQANYVLMEKIRTNDNDCRITLMYGEVLNKNCVIIDDIIDTANTICRAQECLKNMGAKSVEAIATHGIFSKDAFQVIKQFDLKKVTITNSISHSVLPSNFDVLDISNLIKEHVDRTILNI